MTTKNNSGETSPSITSSIGGWHMGDDAYTHGHKILTELIGNFTYVQLHVLNVTGKRITKNLSDWIEARQMCLSWPDSRIWCNQVGAFAGTMKTSPVIATAAGVIASDSRAYGTKTIVGGARFITNALSQKKQGWSIEAIVEAERNKRPNKPVVMGYLRPVDVKDERIPVMRAISRKLDFPIGEHEALSEQVESYLFDKYGESINIGGYSSAFLSDQGFSGVEVYRVCATIVSSGVTACYVDAFDHPERPFLPLNCKDVEYTGKPARSIPNHDKNR